MEMWLHLSTEYGIGDFDFSDLFVLYIYYVEKHVFRSFIRASAGLTHTDSWF
jgi:hypothetical protein